MQRLTIERATNAVVRNALESFALLHLLVKQQPAREAAGCADQNCDRGMQGPFSGRSACDIGVLALSGETTLDTAFALRRQGSMFFLDRGRAGHLSPEK